MGTTQNGNGSSAAVRPPGMSAREYLIATGALRPRTTDAEVTPSRPSSDPERRVLRIDHYGRKAAARALRSGHALDHDPVLAEALEEQRQARRTP